MHKGCEATVVSCFKDGEGFDTDPNNGGCDIDVRFPSAKYVAWLDEGTIFTLLAILPQLIITQSSFTDDIDYITEYKDVCWDASSAQPLEKKKMHFLVNGRCVFAWNRC